MKPHRPAVILDQDVQLPRRAHLRVVRSSAPPPPLALPETVTDRRAAFALAALATSIVIGLALAAVAAWL